MKTQKIYEFRKTRQLSDIEPTELDTVSRPVKLTLAYDSNDTQLTQ